MLDRRPKTGDRLIYRGEKLYTVIGRFKDTEEILNILEDGKTDHTQIIWKFPDGKLNDLIDFI